MRTLLPIILVLIAISLGAWMGYKPLAGPDLGPTVRVDFIDVGQGESILIRTPNGPSALIDAGDEDHGHTVVERLRQSGIKRLDFVIMTSPRDEHIGGLREVLEQFPVGAVLDGTVPGEFAARDKALRTISDRRIQYAEIRDGMNVPLGRSVTLQVLAPSSKPAEWSRDADDNSAVIRLTYGSASMLLTSDIERGGEAKLIAAHKDLESQVLKVADHASAESTSLELLRLVRPEYMVVSVGDRRRQSSPSRRTMERLSEDRSGAALYRTDKDGTISVSTDGRRIVVETEK